ncbi:short-chain dehydrogenase [Pararhodobacter marinus]|uniref:Short-chain dehydrogenase n=1 Tax=Pararhodobacter marinus TaxID=2184063 RepID=A0A2U2C619_9RHOB|nr:SDR family NAD(P)-dependent oxidoreductase [Pararhodobacter marinus]PWE27299.1 short-chain dehydrogenase [Pararhodobacter marinus]
MTAASRSILITGCSSGIGHAAAHDLRARGWRVFAACRQQADCDRLRADGFESPRIDYTDADSIASGLSEVLLATGGTLDALYNNGAHAIPGAVEDLPTDALRAIFEANVFGWHDLTRRVIPVMRAQGHGRIVNCSSVLGFVPYRWRGAYGASKYALEGLTRILALEMADTPIKVVLLQPGPIGTKIRVNSIPHFERFIDWKNSARRAQYETDLLNRLYQPPAKKDRWELGPGAVCKALNRALDDPDPRPSYKITTLTRAMGWAMRLLSERRVARLLSRL